MARCMAWRIHAGVGWSGSPTPRATRAMPAGRAGPPGGGGGGGVAGSAAAEVHQVNAGGLGRPLGGVHLGEEVRRELLEPLGAVGDHRLTSSLNSVSIVWKP